MTDAHCHLIDSKYGDLIPENLAKKAREIGITAIISNGTSIENVKQTIKLAEKFPEVWATVGVHPDEIINNELPKINELLDLAKHSKVVAIGEAALDFFEGITDEQKNMQRKLFEMHIQLATETGLPLVVHNRDADEEILEYLKNFSGGVQLHCFVEKMSYALEAIKRGWYLSFGGIITFKKSGYLREIVKDIPNENILIETDAPYLAPEPMRGTINTPVNVKIVAEWVAGIRNTSINQIEEATDLNTRMLFTKMTK